ncbi:hypothetical protein B296_00010316 [Ensete ventricosum]|uniref:Uncharacterized protein n=1 Tax=Ensete ventricosum TaxID=4639 RepID=A0A426ZF13_ENSVE|nr:hypothetical protein B296_00010316 [Ensete ventricosum]
MGIGRIVVPLCTYDILIFKLVSCRFRSYHRLLNTSSKWESKGKDFALLYELEINYSLNMPIPEAVASGAYNNFLKDLRARQQCIAEITEMIHVASLLHDDVLDDANTRRGIGSLNFVMGNKVHSGHTLWDFLLSRACVALASLKNTEGIVTAPILFAMEEFPELHEVVDRGFDDPENVDIALEYLGKSQGIERTRELAAEHANYAAEAIEALPESDDEDVLVSRRALVDLTHRVITRTK